ncbi:hypothetical protein Y032_0050g1964 [Ancylostoma ceylanicum]|uniref:Pre-nudix hydrolase domain-containing protein n=1 Tax=Ancylostoma ceylanicum TaxID=53326 RepID=A0A016U8U9_9BILA|nr:hypothetical protein Y032_0050g1964 [Ancylostoma ceylanicum]
MVLPCTRNDYGDVEVRTERLSKTLKTKGFFAELQKSLDQWSAEGVKGILFRIALKVFLSFLLCASQCVQSILVAITIQMCAVSDVATQPSREAAT